MEATKTEWRLVPVGVLGIVVDLAASLWYLTLGRTPGGDWIRQSTQWSFPFLATWLVANLDRMKTSSRLLWSAWIVLLGPWLYFGIGPASWIFGR